MQVRNGHQQQNPFYTPEGDKRMQQEISRQFSRVQEDYERIKQLYEQIKAEITKQREFLSRLNHAPSSLSTCSKCAQEIDSSFQTENN